jgi:hypothetical protein
VRQSTNRAKVGLQWPFTAYVTTVGSRCVRVRACVGVREFSRGWRPTMVLIVGPKHQQKAGAEGEVAVGRVWVQRRHAGSEL